MRQEWSPEELLANWTLVDGDWALVANKSGTTRLGFSLLLKFFELEGRFPEVPEEVPPAAVEFVAGLVKVPATDFAKYTLIGRTAEYHRKQIREALGFRPSTVADEKAPAEWLAVEVCPVEAAAEPEGVHRGLEEAHGCGPGPGVRRARGRLGGRGEGHHTRASRGSRCRSWSRWPSPPAWRPSRRRSHGVGASWTSWTC
ncbi:DUF4158 domain-containing protein [Streptomyces sp. NPDC047000]|uniref:DUF4158 domain-containing protein n=1 Tax=Streptomyces sp. NPDC047000 TaxID=3155474 RepID=UPI0033DDE371